MSETHTSAICPGQQTMLPGSGHRYLRMVFMAYWAGSMPSGEVFYFTNYPIQLTPTGVAELEAQVLDLLRTKSGNAHVQNVKYFGYSGAELTENEIVGFGWRVVDGKTLTPISPAVA